MTRISQTNGSFIIINATSHYLHIYCPRLLSWTVPLIWLQNIIRHSLMWFSLSTSSSLYCGWQQGKQSFKPKPPNSELQKWSQHNFFSFWLYFKTFCSKGKVSHLEDLSSPHPSLFLQPVPGWPNLFSLGPFSKPFFGISFCRQVLRESKHKTRALQKSFVLPQPLPTLASSPKMRCGPNRWDALALLTWRSVFWKILFGKFYL